MSSIIRKFNIFRDFPLNIQQNIKTLFVCDDPFYNNFGYCVTIDNKVCGLGKNIYKILGYNQNNNNYNYILMNELSDQNIDEFYEGNECMFARTNQGQIFAWGYNAYGHLCRGYRTDQYLRPKKIKYFDDKNIIHICANFYNYLALSSDGLIYGWGIIVHEFKFKQTFLLNPILLRLNNLLDIKCVLNDYSFYSYNLLVASQNGLVYQLKIKESDDQQFYCESKLFCDLNEINNLIENSEQNIENKIQESCIELSKTRLIFQTDDCVVIYNKSDMKIEKTSYKTLFEYFLFEEKKTYKTIHIKSNELFVIKFEKINQNFIRYLKTIYSFQQNDEKSYQGLRISNELSQSLQSDFKCFHQSEDFGLFVMNDNKVYCFGYNSFGKLGLGDQQKVYENTLIHELCDQNIDEFYEGVNCMFARTIQSQIFAWGDNYYGLLGVGNQSNAILRPQIIEYFNDKNIIHISCGLKHCLALSSNGTVFAWGYNQYGQIGCGDVKRKGKIRIPVKIDFQTPIKFICCADEISFAVNVNGYAYHWGKVAFKAGVFEQTPKLIIANNVAKVNFVGYSPYGIGSGIYIILDNNGSVFTYNMKKRKTEFEFHIKCSDLYDDYLFNLLQTDECVYQLKLGEIPTKTNFINFYDFLSQKSLKYKKTIHITKDGYLMTNEIQLNKQNNHDKSGENESESYDGCNKNQLLIIQKKDIFENKFQKTFKIIEQAGEGGFGKVFKVEKLGAFGYFAVKKMEVLDDHNLNEIQIMAKINSIFVVQYIDSWIEMKVMNNKIKKLYFIQMELCSSNLRDIIDLMKNSEQKFLKFNYFISCEILRELTECVNYLHSISIIHRDLKPANILITNGINGRFIKLCDFGLSKIHGKSIHSRMVGTDIYMAPEVRYSKIYNTKSDIYSLALIATEIFQFGDSLKKIRNQTDFNKYLEKYLNTVLEKNFRQLLDTLSKCLQSEDYNSRYNCEELLQKINEFSVDKNNVLNDENITEFELYLGNLKNKNGQVLLKKYFEAKLGKFIQNDEGETIRNDESQSITITDAGSIYKPDKKEPNGVKIFFNNLIKRWKTPKSEPNVEKIETQLIVNKNVPETRFHRFFKINDEIGSGAFGKVFKVEELNIKNVFAIKKVNLNHDFNLNEIQIMSQMSSIFVVQYIDSWIESEVIFNEIKNFLFIQMEFCSHNLRQIIKLLKEITDQRFQRFNFFISCEIVRELIECVKYLHSLNPPIIHRDLKPENILISDGSNGSFFKLCDFGLSKFHQISVHTRMKGTLSYMAPEVLYSNNYNTKSDIYSLALIMTEIFQFEDNVKTVKDQTDFNKYLFKYLNTNLEKNFRQLLETLSPCLLSKDYNSRPNCEELLIKINELAVDKHVLLNDEKFKDYIEHLEIQKKTKYQMEFLLKFVNIKLV